MYARLGYDAAQCPALNQRASLCSGLTKIYPSSREKKEEKKKLFLKTKPTAAYWSGICLQPYPSKGAGSKNIGWINQRKQRKEVSHLTRLGPTRLASRYSFPLCTKPGLLCNYSKLCKSCTLSASTFLTKVHSAGVHHMGSPYSSQPFLLQIMSNSNR